MFVVMMVVLVLLWLSYSLFEVPKDSKTTDLTRWLRGNDRHNYIGAVVRARGFHRRHTFAVLAHDNQKELRQELEQEPNLTPAMIAEFFKAIDDAVGMFVHCDLCFE